MLDVVDNETYRHVGVNSSSAFSHQFMYKLWEATKKNQHRSHCGMWEPVRGLALYATISVHEEFSIQCHNEISFKAPVIWEIQFPVKKDARSFDNEYPLLPADKGTVTVCEMVGQTFDRDWVKLMVFSDFSEL